MYIRVKVRTLFVLCITVVALVAISYLTLPRVLLAQGRYNAVIRYFPHSGTMPMALYQSALQYNTTAVSGMTYILPGNNMASVGSATTPPQVLTAMERFQLLVQRYPDFRYLNQAKWNLALLEEETGDLLHSQILFQQLVASNSIYAHQAAQHLKAYPAFQKEQRQKSSEPNKHGQSQYASSQDPLGLHISKQDGYVTGVVTAGSRRISTAYVFLRQAGDNSITVPPQTNYIGAYTDASGRYRLYDVPPGRYEVGVGVFPSSVYGYFLPTPAGQTVSVAGHHVIKYDVHFVPRVQVISPVKSVTIQGNRVRFSWKTYPGAAYYRLSITSIVLDGNSQSTMSYNLPGSVQSTHVTYTMNHLRSLLPEPGKDSVHGLIPAAVLGAMYPGGQFTWSVDAYRADGVLLSSSRGYYAPLTSSSAIRRTESDAFQPPLFRTASEGRLAGDVDVLHYRYQLAQQAYLREISNPYALRALGVMALYGIGYSSPGDPKLALSYLTRIKHPDKDVLRLIEDARMRLRS